MCSLLTYWMRKRKTITLVGYCERHYSVGAAANWRGRKKFFSETNVFKKNIDGKPMFGIALDGRELSSPNRLPLFVPSQILASSLAYEWKMQTAVIRPATMPLVVLACSAVDVTPFNRQNIIDEVMRYLTTDTLCHFQDPTSNVYARQQLMWTPIIDEFRVRYGNVGITSNMSLPKHDPETISRLRLHLLSLDDYTLTAVESLTSGLKSVIAATKVLHDVQSEEVPNDIALEVMNATRLEEEFQIEEWGLVEGGHDVDRANISTQIYAATHFLRCIFTA